MREAGKKVAETGVEVSEIFKLHLGSHLQHWQEAELSVSAIVHQVQHLPAVWIMLHFILNLHVQTYNNHISLQNYLSLCVGVCVGNNRP